MILPRSESIETVLRRQWDILRDYILKEQAPPSEPTVDSPPAPPPVVVEDAVRIYTRACDRFGSKPNGAVLAAARYGSKVIKPSDVISDADVLALVDALTHRHFPPVAALDLSDVDGSRCTRTATSLALSHAIAEGKGLKFLAVAPGTSLGSHGVERLFQATAKNGLLKVLRCSDCDLGDAGADVISELLPSVSLERLDVSRNKIGPRAAWKLRDVALRHGVAVKLRGNARRLERACGAVQALGALLTPLAGTYLVLEAKRLDLDPGAVAACALYVVSTWAFFVLTAAPHFFEAKYAAASRGLNNNNYRGSWQSASSSSPLRRGGSGGEHSSAAAAAHGSSEQPGDASTEALARVATYLAVAGAHAPFLAFVDLGLPRNFGVFLWTTCAGGAVANVLRARRDFTSPPTLRPSSLTADKLPLFVLGGLVPFFRFPALRVALAKGNGFTALVAALLLAVFASALDLTPVCKPLAYVLHLAAVGLHYFCVLTALVWHFLPGSGGAPGGAAQRPPPITTTTVN